MREIEVSAKTNITKDEAITRMLELMLYTKEHTSGDTISMSCRDADRDVDYTFTFKFRETR